MMLKALTKPQNLVIGDIPAARRWKFIMRANNPSRVNMHQHRYLKSNSENAVAGGSNSRTLSLPPLSVFIAEDAASAVANHNRITRQLVPPLAIYTDGSKMNNRLGAAAIARPLGTYSQAYLDTEANQTINTAELMGIWMAISIATKANVPEVVVFSDSQTALKAISKPQDRLSCFSGSALTETLQEIHQIGVGIQFHWVPAHKGIIGNQMADKLAKEAARFQEKSSRNTPACAA